MATFAGTSSDDFIIATVNGTEYRGGAGNDTYIITSLIPANAVISIVDTEGANKIQLADGLTIASSSFLANAVELTLSNGAKVQVTGASTFTYDIGANAVAGDSTGTVGQTYTQFAAALGVPTLPATGSTAGTPSFVVPNSSAPATPSFTVAGPASATEGGSATYTVSLSAAQSTATTVSYAVTFGGGATAADLGDGTALTGTLTFAAGEVSKTIVLPVKFDTTAETGEQAIVTLSSSSTGTQLGATKSVTTALNDAPTASFTLKSDVSGTPTLEGSSITFTVTPSGIVTQDTTLTVNLTGATVGAISSQASASDFSPASQTLVFKAGSSVAQTAVISVVNDNVTEGIEGYKASLLDSGFSELSSTTGTINDGSVQGGTGQTFTLTSSLDILNGTAGDDTLIGTDTTFTSGDQLKGGAGTDTLRLFLAGANTALVTSSEIEVLSVQDRAAGNSVTLANFTGLTTIESVNNQNDTGTNPTAFTSVPASASTINLKDLGVANATKGTSISYLDAGVSGSSDAVAVNVSNVTAAQLLTVQAASTAGGIETFNIKSSGSNNTKQIELASALQTGVTKQTVNVTGDKNVDLKLSANMTTLNAGTFTGALRADVSGAAAYTITGGSGDDRFAFAGNLTTADIVNGGTGTNTVAASTAAAFTTGLQLTNINTLEVSTATTGGETLALANVSGAKDVYLSDIAGGIANAQNFTVTGLVSGATVTIETDKDADPGTVTYTLANAAGTADVLNLKLNANDSATAAAFTSTVVTGFETLNIVSSLAAGQTAGTGTHTFTGITGAGLQAITVSGAAPVVITANTGMANLNSIDASSATGAITLGNGTTAALIHAADGATFKTGSGNDAVSYDVTADAVLALDAGTGTDTLNLLGTASTGVTKIDLSSTTDQITQVNGGANNAVKQIGFENVVSALATNGVDVTGSDGKNTITGSNGVNDTIRGGAGADTIDVGTTGSDVLKYANTDVASGTTLANADVVANFAIAADLIDTSGFTFKSVSGSSTTAAFSTDDFTVAAVALGSATAGDTTYLYTLTSANNSVGASQAEIDATVAEIVAAGSTSVFTATAGAKVLVSVVGADTNDVALFYYNEAGTNGIQASELSLVGVFTGASQFTAAVLQ